MIIPDGMPGAVASVEVTTRPGAISVTWEEAQGAEYYAVARQTYGKNTWTLLAPNVTETAYEDSTAVSGILYRYRVRAYNIYGKGTAANSDYVTLQDGIPDNITGVAAEAQSGVISVSWNEVQGADYYVVARQISGKTAWTVVGASVTEAAFEDATAAAGTEYRYRVRAYNAQGSGAAANSDYVTALAD